MHGFLLLSQTNFLGFNLFKPKSTPLPFILLVFISLFISACSTKPIIEKVTPITKEVIKKIDVTETAETKISLAKSLNKKLPRNDQALIEQQAIINSLLIEASELYIQQKNFSKALWLANKINDIPQENYENTYKILLIKAHSLVELNYLPQAQHQLKLATELVNYTTGNPEISSLKLNHYYYFILNKILYAQGKIVPAVTAQLNAFALNPDALKTETLNNTKAIWHKLERLTDWQLKELIKTNPPFINGWAQLLNYSHKFGANPKQFSRYLTLWQQQNPTHPATDIIEQLQETNVAIHREPVTPKINIETYIDKSNEINSETDIKSTTENIMQSELKNDFHKKIENIAILLPLSGNQQQAGIAAQQGILAAYQNNTESNITFIDTNKIDWENVVVQIAELNIDHIIGPLLKSNVEMFLTLSKQHPSLQVPTLLLNLSSEHQLFPYQTALSMRPEDEAIQAATTLSQHNYHHPIILSHNDSVSKRIAVAFSEQWQSSTGKAVDIIYFNQGKEMQNSLKENLDVNASQARIKQLTNRLSSNIKSEPRNRRDIDMIYVIGSDAQTRLIKPYIDVNISPFANIIPVYASSRSHSSFNDKHNGASSTNDLQGLTFTQIPWLLPSEQQDKNLNQLSNSLWPKRSDSLSRIFAMGFDGYHLLSKIPLMKQAPYIRHFGQTGTLILNNNNILTRSLIWGQYKKDKVTSIVMD